MLERWARLVTNVMLRCFRIRRTIANVDFIDEVMYLRTWSGRAYRRLPTETRSALVSGLHTGNCFASLPPRQSARLR